MFVYGVVAVVHDKESLAQLDQVLGIPVVTIDEVRDNSFAVISNDRQGMGLAVKHLHELGHRRIGLCASGYGCSTRRRIEAFQAACTESGIDADDCPVEASTGNTTERLAKLLLRAPTAIVAASEALGIAAAQSLALLGRRIPEDISLVSPEADGVSKLMSPPHTTIGQDFGALASEAIESLSAHYSDDATGDERRVAEVDFILQVRESTASV